MKDKLNKKGNKSHWLIQRWKGKENDIIREEIYIKCDSLIEMVVYKEE